MFQHMSKILHHLIRISLCQIWKTISMFRNKIEAVLDLTTVPFVTTFTPKESKILHSACFGWSFFISSIWNYVAE